MAKSYKPVQLSSSYAWQLLQTQIQLEMATKVSVHIVTRLLEIYALGVEYYESMQSQKYIFFKRKISTLMSSENFAKAMGLTEQEPSTPSKSLKNNSHPQGLEISHRNSMTSLQGDNNKIVSTAEESQATEGRRNQQSKFRKQELEKKVLTKTASFDAAFAARKMLEDSEKLAVDTSGRLQLQIKEQTQRLQDRMQKRKHKAIQKSLSVVDLARRMSGESVEIQPDKQKERGLGRITFQAIIRQDEEQKHSEEQPKILAQQAKDVESQVTGANDDNYKRTVQTRARNNSIKLDYLNDNQLPRNRYRTYSQELPERQTYNKLHL